VVGKPSCRVIVHPEWLGTDKAKGVSLGGDVPGCAGMQILREVEVRASTKRILADGPRVDEYLLKTAFICAKI
jgi:hypothetical protein